VYRPCGSPRTHSSLSPLVPLLYSIPHRLRTAPVRLLLAAQRDASRVRLLVANLLAAAVMLLMLPMRVLAVV
jgi:hypothetical protein